MDLKEKKTGFQMEITLVKRVKAAELTIMTRQLATMISSGMTLLRAFYVLEEQIENKLLRETVGAVREDIEAGISFSEALAKHPKIFSPLYVAMVKRRRGGRRARGVARAGLRPAREGRLAAPPGQVRDGLPDGRHDLRAVRPGRPDRLHRPGVRGRVQGLRRRAAGDHEVHGRACPTRSRSQWYIFIVGGVGGFVGFKKWRKSSWGRPQWDRLRLRVPFKIGETVQKIALARWSRTFSALYSAGVPIMQAIEVTGQTAGNAAVEDAMEAVIESVKSGGSIAAPLKDAPVFPAMVAQMIAVGEETGNLDTMLTKVADFYEDEVAAAIKALTSILEPVMIVLVGGIVGFIVVAMYMPMFKVYDAIK